MHCFILCLFVANKKDDATTAAHSKRIIELLQNRQHLYADIRTIWNNIDFCAEKYRRATALYLLSMLAHALLL